MIAERLASARQELSVKSPAQIDVDSAATWGARAVAAFDKYCETGNDQWLMAAAQWAHEMCEHAAGGGPAVLEKLGAELSELTGGRL